ncbi:MAG: hypothetical protein RMJ98_16240 [Myxococcales bacterium]|nr:hypothetical protein [Polyangiaceae bacterium]MDW8250845.1 hypothetical protein [Myxococcales bacterium]
MVPLLLVLFLVTASSPALPAAPPPASTSHLPPPAGQDAGSAPPPPALTVGSPGATPAGGTLCCLTFEDCSPCFPRGSLPPSTAPEWACVEGNKRP